MNNFKATSESMRAFDSVRTCKMSEVNINVSINMILLTMLELVGCLISWSKYKHEMKL